MIDLTKWPRLLVTGTNVTPEQANEILVRTDDWYFCSNDRSFKSAVYGMVGVGYQDMRVEWTQLDSFTTSIGTLDLHHCGNERIMSSWLGGPHGWCDWDGRIGCSTYNLGKWPTVEEITEDWATIAAAFPYLDLRAQVVTDEGDGEIAAEWAVCGGTAALLDGPYEPIAAVSELDLAVSLALCMGPVSRERGVTLDRLRQAVEQVKAARLDGGEA